MEKLKLVNRVELSGPDMITIRHLAKLYNLTSEQVEELICRVEAGALYYENDEYFVIKREKQNDDGIFYHLSIRRQDRGALHNWRDLQEIKNQLCGKDCWAYEIYPPEDHLVDNANQYHLWVLPNGEYYPIGWQEGRQVQYESFGKIKQKK